MKDNSEAFDAEESSMVWIKWASFLGIGCGVGTGYLADRFKQISLYLGGAISLITYALIGYFFLSSPSAMSTTGWIVLWILMFLNAQSSGLVIISKSFKSHTQARFFSTFPTLPLTRDHI